MTTTHDQATRTGDEAAVLATVETMAAALHRGDVDAVVATYVDDAAVVFEPGTPTAGTAAIRESFAELAALAPHFVFTSHRVVVAGDVALHLAPWTMTATAPDGSAVADAGLSVAVLRRTPAGWRLAVDDPHGEQA